MARFLLQAANDEDHLTPAREVFGLPGLASATISTAFMTASGLSLLAGVLEPIADKTRIFVGIRNGVTTVQAIQKALEIGCETYMVDTGSRQRIFHPKLYYARSAVRAKLLLGSANLTMGGLRTNIEASVLQEFDLAADAAFLADLEGKLAAMIVDYPHNVIRAVDAAQLADMLRSGRLLDERKARPPEPAGSSADRALDTVPKMNLHTTPLYAARPPCAPGSRSGGCPSSGCPCRACAAGTSVGKQRADRAASEHSHRGQYQRDGFHVVRTGRFGRDRPPALFPGRCVRGTCMGPGRCARQSAPRTGVGQFQGRDQRFGLRRIQNEADSQHSRYASHKSRAQQQDAVALG